MANAVCSVLKALLTRLLFFVHCVLAIWRVVDVYKDPRFWIISAALGFLLVETIVTLAKKKGEEWKWFCPSFFFYLCGVVPAIWLLELDRLEDWKVQLNSTAVAINVTLEALPAIKGIVIPIRLDSETWVTSIEQSMLLLLIVGRWLLPKGKITRDQLSQLLFVYIGMASDIMELYILFTEQNVLLDRGLTYAILGVWSLSLLQFTLVLTATKARKPRMATNHSFRSQSGRTHHRRDPHDGDSERGGSSCCKDGGCCAGGGGGGCGAGCWESEVWSILIMVFFQDGPFLAVRLYTLVKYQILTYNILFFASKNVLVILLQFYRLIVIATIKSEPAEEGENGVGYDPVSYKSPDSSPYRSSSEGTPRLQLQVGSKKATEA